MRMLIAPYDYYSATDDRLKVQRVGVTTYYIYDSNNNLIAEADQNKQITRHYLHSATGHTLAITDKDETTVNQYAYSPYGRILGETETSGLEQPFKYVGKYGVQHEGDELYYMRARYYDADTGRFTMEDPIGIEGGLNVSLYGNANPVVYIDPEGTLVVNGGLALFGAVLGGVAGASSAALNGGSLTEIVISGGLGAVSGAVSGATMGAVPAGPMFVGLSRFGASAATGAVSAGIGETAGQLVTGSRINVDRIGTAAMLGSTSGMGGHLVGQMGLGARGSIATGLGIDVLGSPVVARANNSNCN